MRVIAGGKKGFPLKSPKGSNTRPTSDKIKGAMFNSLANYINFHDKKAFDCFAGSGSLGIEFLSRGGNHCTFVELNQQSITCIKENIKKTGLEDQSKIIKGNILSILLKLQVPYDLFLIDPPYKQQLAQKTIDLITEGNLLSKNGILVVETDKGEVVNFTESYLEILTEKEYGDTKITTLIRG